MDDRATSEDGDFIWKYFTFFMEAMLCRTANEMPLLPKKDKIFLQD